MRAPVCERAWNTCGGMGPGCACRFHAVCVCEYVYVCVSVFGDITQPSMYECIPACYRTELPLPFPPSSCHPAPFFTSPRTPHPTPCTLHPVCWTSTPLHPRLRVPLCASQGDLALRLDGATSASERGELIAAFNKTGAHMESSNMHMQADAALDGPLRTRNNNHAHADHAHSPSSASCVVSCGCEFCP